MGLSNSIIALKGNHLNKISQIFETLGYVDNNRNKEYDKWEEAETFLFDNYFDLANQSIAIRGIWVDNNWTSICDPEMVDAMEDDKISQLSGDLDAIILTFMVQSTSGLFWFAKYDKTKQRHFFAVDGRIIENMGDPLTEEQGLNINERICGDDIIKLADRLGVDFEAPHTQTTFIVKELGYGDQVQQEINQVNQPTLPKKQATQTGHDNQGKKKPWWRF
ncbi:MAG: hypothetical protein H6585_06825 [Flavobacteriales bacterium]|nr:hypothetical protein [Flavobacteriales bacterium]MCB9448044.1 hypothetical protein [Flavobacteriales bacterium]